jgi:hypothetical protein
MKKQKAAQEKRRVQNAEKTDDIGNTLRDDGAGKKRQKPEAVTQ